MDVSTAVILLFIILEAGNIFILYFRPGSKKANGLGVFNDYEKVKNYPELKDLVSYLIFWVAGTKLIFIALLSVIAISGGFRTKTLAVAVMIPSIATFYLKLYPLIRKMDKENRISPAGYSRTLFIMISVIIAAFAAALVISLTAPDVFSF